MQKLLYALRDNELISVDSVERGRKCNCICPYCKQPLVAKKGNYRIHHFAHDKNSSCEHGYETSLHLLAKEILSESKTIVLPKMQFGSRNSIIIEQSRVVKITDVKMEQSLGNIKPDIIVDTELGRINIEIYVTHKIDSTKIEKIKSLKIDTIEIDLSKQSELINREQLSQILLNDNPLKKWIYNRKIDKIKTDYLFSSNVTEIEKCRRQDKGTSSYKYCKFECNKYLGEKDENSFYCKNALIVNKKIDIDANVDSVTVIDGVMHCSLCGDIMTIEYVEQEAFFCCLGCANAVSVMEYTKKHYNDE